METNSLLTPAVNLTERLSSGKLLIADGGIGTMLQAKGLAVGEAPEKWNLEHAEAVQDIHQQYIDAGAEWITTNTFGALRRNLVRHSLEGQLVEIVSAAVQAAKNASAGKAFVMGDIGPLTEMVQPYGLVGESEATDNYAELAQVLAKCGVDGLLLETFYDLDELTTAVHAIQSTGLPVLATVTFTPKGRTMMGSSIEDVCQKLDQLPVIAFGSNCGFGPELMATILKGMHSAQGKPLIAQPNAGLPETSPDGSLHYSQGPDQFSEAAVNLRSLGCGVLGGCCGTTPAHIASIKAALTA